MTSPRDASGKDDQGDILIVDDTPDNLRLLSAMLGRHDLKVRKALTGQWAIAAAQVAPPDLILLDIKMPEMSGYEVCERLKADPTTQAIPIIFISALDDTLDKVKAFAAGGADYITKPFQEAEVLARIAHQLNLRRLQGQLVAQNAELVRSNRELEQFASVVAHDLQQPLQSILGYTKLISLACPDIKTSPAQPYLENILDASGRMQQMIQDWLAYAQAGQAQPLLAPVDGNALLDQVRLNLKVALTETGAKLIHGDLPRVLGNDVQLMQLFQNLISNGLKFTQPGIRPEITISVEPQPQAWRFGIHDNGIGISAEHLGQIFEAFHRLHDTQTYPGSGIGLATCQKIVEHHGGRIWAESQLGQGTTFYVILPAVPGDDG
ncbi:hybrid sensor histidine kinase/response regulator [filamentous cyanobacterium CCT1]|nr:hybrid sensor histidine kinase/response regulator [filamentous cyanobacterium CCT1]PSN81287.1 hybrid sensor histidine kinase/response regulator [filamentous cyanobacterium CCP4]